MTNESTTDDVPFEMTVEGARAAAAADDLGAWVRAYLSTDGSDNEVLGEQLDEVKNVWIGPLVISFDRLHRLAGPADQPTLERLTDDDIETVEGMEESIEEGWEPGPLVASFSEDHLVLEDGNHRVEGLRRAGNDGYWTIIGFADEAERARYEEMFD